MISKMSYSFLQKECKELTPVKKSINKIIFKSIIFKYLLHLRCYFRIVLTFDRLQIPPPVLGGLHSTTLFLPLLFGFRGTNLIFVLEF